MGAIVNAHSPPAQPVNATTSRGVEKQARFTKVAPRVTIFNEDGRREACKAENLKRYLDATNAEFVITNGGKLVAIKLLSVANDHGHLGEQQGNSVVTTTGAQFQCEHRWLNGRNVRSGIRHPYSPQARQSLR